MDEQRLTELENAVAAMIPYIHVEHLPKPWYDAYLEATLPVTERVNSRTHV